MLAELKSTAKLAGSVSSKVGKTFEERIREADTKLSEGERRHKNAFILLLTYWETYDNGMTVSLLYSEFNQRLGEKQSSCAKERVTEMKRIKTWKRNTEIASTANQSYQVRLRPSSGPGNDLLSAVSGGHLGKFMNWRSVIMIIWMNELQIHFSGGSWWSYRAFPLYSDLTRAATNSSTGQNASRKTDRCERGRGVREACSRENRQQKKVITTNK